MSDWYVANLILIQGTFVAILLALSIQLPLRMGVFSFAGVGSYTIGGYTAAILTIRYQLPTLAVIAIGMVIAAAVGYLLALVVQRLDGLYLAMATIAFDLILTVIVINGGELTGGPTGLYGAIGELSIGEILAIVLVVVLALAYSERGRLGRRIDAVREDPELALAMGVDVRRYRVMAFVVSGLLGACAGGISVLLRTAIAPEDVGFHLVVLALTMIIVGGTRSWLGAVIGAVIFTWLPSALAIVGEWQAIIYGAIVAVVAILAPGGVLGVTTKLYRHAQERRRPPEITQAATVDGPAVGEAELTALRELTDSTSGRTS